MIIHPVPSLPTRQRPRSAGAPGRLVRTHYVVGTDRAANARSRQRLVARVRSWDGSGFQCLSTIPLPLCIFPPLARRTPPVTGVILHLPGPQLQLQLQRPPTRCSTPRTPGHGRRLCVTLCAPVYPRGPWLEVSVSGLGSCILALVLVLDPGALGLVAVAGCRASQTASFRRTSSQHPYIPMSPQINQRASHRLLRYRPDDPGPCLRFRPSPEGPFPGLHGGPSSWIPH